jgi:transposase
MTRAELERRRLKAAEDLKYLTQAEIARRYKVSRTTASRWDAKRRNGESLKRTYTQGRPYRVPKDALIALIRSREWVLHDLAREIERRFRAGYCEDHVYRLWARYRTPAP